MNGLNTLVIVFVVLKLTHYIDWGWFWIFSPIWGYFLLLCILDICNYFIQKR